MRPPIQVGGHQPLRDMAMALLATALMVALYAAVQQQDEREEYAEAARLAVAERAALRQARSVEARTNGAALMRECLALAEANAVEGR